MRLAKSLGSPDEVDTKPSTCFRPYFLARTRCSGVRPVVKPSKPAALTALIFFSSDHCLAAEGWLTRDQRLAMWAILGIFDLGFSIGEGASTFASGFDRRAIENRNSKIEN